MSDKKATIKFDFGMNMFVAVADWDEDIFSVGTTAEIAVENLRHECDKHELWP